jgi:hypothetical protein
MSQEKRHMPQAEQSALTMNRRGRLLVLVAAFLGWMFAGWEMSLLPLSARSVTIGILQQQDDADWLSCLERRRADGSSAGWVTDPDV